MWICCAARHVHFTDASRRKGAPFLPEGTNVQYKSGSTFIKIIGRFVPVIILKLVCLGNTSKKQDCKITASSLVLLVQTFDKVIDELGMIKTWNSTVLWWLLSNQVTLYNYNFCGGFNKCLRNFLSTNFLKFLAISFGWDC